MAAHSLRYTVKQFAYWLRRSFYANMGHIANDWAPDAIAADDIKPAARRKAIRLDFAVPKKHRLFWAHRRINHLPH